MNALTDIIPVTRINYLMIDEDGKLIQDFEINTLKEAIDLLPEISETFAVERIIELETGGGSRPNASDITPHVMRMAVEDYINGKSSQYDTEETLIERIQHYKGAFRTALEDAESHGEMKRNFIPQSETHALQRAYQGR